MSSRGVQKVFGLVLLALILLFTFQPSTAQVDSAANNSTGQSTALVMTLAGMINPWYPYFHIILILVVLAGAADEAVRMMR